MYVCQQRSLKHSKMNAEKDRAIEKCCSLPFPKNYFIEFNIKIQKVYFVVMCNIDNLHMQYLSEKLSQHFHNFVEWNLSVHLNGTFQEIPQNLHLLEQTITLKK